MTDLHLGHRQYGSVDREKDFYVQLQKCVAELNKHNCEVVIIGGDIFDKANPSPESMHFYKEYISQLKAKTILAIQGNHTMLLRDNHYSVDEFFNDNDIDGYYLLNDNYWSNNDLWVDGITYRGNSQLEEFREIQKQLASVDSDKNQYRILVIHQAVSEFCGFMGEDLSIKDFDTQPYDIIICGHIHSHHLSSLDDDTWFLQPGSIERLNTTEAHDDNENGKGVWTIDTDKNKIVFHPVKQRRAFFMGDIDIKDESDIEEHLKNVKVLCSDLEFPPIIAYNYHDYIGNRMQISSMITDVSANALLTNCNIYDELKEEIEYDIPEDGIITIDTLIRQNDDLSESEQQLAIDIHNAFKNNADTVESLLEDYRNKHFNNIQEDFEEQDDFDLDEMITFFDNL